MAEPTSLSGWGFLAVARSFVQLPRSASTVISSKNDDWMLLSKFLSRHELDNMERRGNSAAADLNTIALEHIPACSWAFLAEGAAQAKSAFHTFALATCGDGGPDLRTVVLRDASEEDRTVLFHTDRRSPKFTPLERAAEVSCLFYDRERKLQLRIKGGATLHWNDGLAEHRWEQSSHSSRQCYRVASAPGTKLTAADIESPSVSCGRDNFAVVRVTVGELDWLYLRAAGHRRARLNYRASRWQGNWIMP